MEKNLNILSNPNMKDVIFVLAPDGKPLMPSKRYRHFRSLMKEQCHLVRRDHRWQKWCE